MEKVGSAANDIIGSFGFMWPTDRDLWRFDSQMPPGPIFKKNVAFCANDNIGSLCFVLSTDRGIFAPCSAHDNIGSLGFLWSTDRVLLPLKSDPPPGTQN